MTEEIAFLLLFGFYVSLSLGILTYLVFVPPLKKE